MKALNGFLNQVFNGFFVMITLCCLLLDYHALDKDIPFSFTLMWLGLLVTVAAPVIAVFYLTEWWKERERAKERRLKAEADAKAAVQAERKGKIDEVKRQIDALFWWDNEGKKKHAAFMKRLKEEGLVV